MDIKKIRFLREKLRLVEREMSDPFGRDGGCCGLTLAQCHTLLEVGTRGKVSLVDLASSFGLDTSTLSRTIQGLVVLGLVSRLINEKDRRYVAISLTEQGRKLFEQIETTFDTYFSEVLELIPSEKRDVVIESIGFFSDAVRKRNKASGCGEADARRCEADTASHSDKQCCEADTKSQARMASQADVPSRGAKPTRRREAGTAQRDKVIPAR